MPEKRTFHTAWWSATGLLVGGIVLGGAYFLTRGTYPSVASAQEGDGAGRHAGIHVEIVRPQKGGIERTSEQPGTIQAFESAHLYAEVPGYLKKQTVDIGDRVKKGQELARIDVPELAAQAKRSAAGLEKAQAGVKVAEARLASAKADWKVAVAGVTKAEATEKSAKALRTYRERQFQRIQDLYATRSIEEKIVDEEKEKTEAAIEAERSARAAIESAKALVDADLAKIQQAEADVADTKAAVKVAEAELEKAQVMVQFATIVSPYDGVITQRNFFPGDFIKAATEGGEHIPLLTVERTDKMRVIVQIPDRDVPFTDPGEPAFLEIDALPGKKLEAKVSRVASSEDPQTRTMRAEIDLPNPTGKICHGMYGKVTIVLEKSPELLSVPSSCLVGKAEGGKGAVYVVRDGHAHRVPVQIGSDNGVRVGILAGIKPDDDVVVHPSSSLGDGLPVTVIANSEGAAKGRGH
jgi:RND family efflux transporter MFP subunit